MTDYHKNPLLSWRPPVELSGWARAEAKRRGQRIGDFLSSLLIAERDRIPPHRCPVKGWCAECGEMKGGK